MYKSTKVAVVIPCYNEEKLIEKTISTLPASIDYIIAVNDASKDDTLAVLHRIAKSNKKVTVLDNDANGGIGYSLKNGFHHALKHTDAEAIGIVSGDAQCDPEYIEPMLDVFIERKVDYIKGNRFFQRDALKSMPAYRRFGNIFISLLTKFSTGYYSISDTTMGFGFLRRSILEQVNYDLVRNRYDYENSMLIALSIVSARLKDYPVPAIYGEETSTIDFWPTVGRVLRVVWVGFWQRIYYKYILFSFHPIALFLFGGLLLTLVGFGFGVYMIVEKIIHSLSPSTGTVMLCVLPLIVGFQMLLTALIMDVYNEDRP
jgi:glycosyltransferase involved in cell wall biosynthesis